MPLVRPSPSLQIDLQGFEIDFYAFLLERYIRLFTVSIDLESQEIRGPDGGVIGFDIDPHRKHCLLNGLDDIGLTLEKAGAIESYEQEHAQSRPWL